MVLIPVAAPALVFLIDGISAKDAILRGVILLGMTPMTLFVGAYWGLALGMLSSPSWYLGTDFGLRWRELCGVRSVAGCRWISLVLVMVGTSSHILLFWLARVMVLFT